jgi:EREBP-like factor
MCGANVIEEWERHNELRRRLWPQKNKPRKGRLFARFPEVLELDDEDFEADFQKFEADTRDSDFEFDFQEDSDDEVIEIKPPTVKTSISKGIAVGSLGVYIFFRNWLLWKLWDLFGKIAVQVSGDGMFCRLMVCFGHFLCFPVLLFVRDFGVLRSGLGQGLPSSFLCRVGIPKLLLVCSLWESDFGCRSGDF